jgi:hypothetical protein
MEYSMDFHRMLQDPKHTHLFDAAVCMKICQFVDKYVSRVYGTRTVSAWLSKNREKTIFDMITMSDIACTVAVIENFHERWDETINGSGREHEEFPMAPKFTRKKGRGKRKGNSMR